MALALGMLLTLPSLGNGLVLDDFHHRHALLMGTGYFDQPVHPLDLFKFFPAAEMDTIFAKGVVGWWTTRGAHIAFWRPLSSLTHWLDHACWPDTIWLMHLHSLAWYAALIAAAALVLAELTDKKQPPWLAGLALVLFAIDDRHGLAVGWVATRNMLVASTFGVLAIALHLRARRGVAHAAWLSPLCLMLALLGAEYGIGAFGYLLAHAIIYERGAGPNWWRRLLPIAPHVAVIAAWQIAYSALGYGAWGVGLYTHPLKEPAKFALAVLLRPPVLYLSQLTLPFAELWAVIPVGGAVWVALASALAVAVLIYALRRPLATEPATRMLALGAAFSVLPYATTLPNERLLFFAGIGGAWLVARAIALGAEVMARGGSARLIALGVVALLILRHGVGSAVGLPLRVQTMRFLGAVEEHCDASLPDDPALAQQTLVVLNTPHEFLSTPILVRRHFTDGTPPRNVRTLGATGSPVTITRIDDRTLELRPEGSYLARQADAIAWSPEDPHHAGYAVDLGDVRFEVIAATPSGQPTAVRASFAAPLEDPRWRFSAWRGVRFEDTPPPAIGESLVLPPADLLGTLRAVW